MSTGQNRTVPLTCRLRGPVEYDTAIQDSVGIERHFYTAQQVQLVRVLQGEGVVLLEGADAVLAEYRPAQRQPGLEQLAHHDGPLVRIFLVDGQVNVPVPRVTAAGNGSRPGAGDPGDRRHEVADRGPRDDDVDEVVKAGPLRQPERLLPRLDERLALVRRQNVHLQGAEPRDVLGQL